jgi:hypothetical protein
MSGERLFSVIIPTVGRTTLSRAVTSVLAQVTNGRAQEPDAGLEVIVVNDSGAALAGEAWQADARVQMIETARVERSAARNAGAERARGTYLVFLDDDDWLLPGALEQFRRKIQEDGCAWILGDCALVGPDNASLGTLRTDCEGNVAVQAITGEWFALQGSCIRRDLFFGAGRFGPLTMGEDNELAGRIALQAELCRVHATVTGILCATNFSTSTRTGEQKARYAELRDAILERPEAYARLRDSAREAYWRGRLTRLYLVGVVLQLRRGQPGKAARRAGEAARALLTPAAIVDARPFWRGMLRSHASRVDG